MVNFSGFCRRLRGHLSHKVVLESYYSNLQNYIGLLGAIYIQVVAGCGPANMQVL